MHTRISIPLSSSLEKGGYFSSVLTKINKGETYKKPENNQLFDIILIDDLVNAYYLIGLKGRNKSDYFIGSSQPKTLHQYFKLFENYKNGKYQTTEVDNFNLNSDIFSINELVKDTGFSLSLKFEDFIKTMD